MAMDCPRGAGGRCSEEEAHLMRNHQQSRLQVRVIERQSWATGPEGDGFAGLRGDHTVDTAHPEVSLVGYPQAHFP